MEEFMVLDPVLWCAVVLLVVWPVFIIYKKRSIRPQKRLLSLDSREEEIISFPGMGTSPDSIELAQVEEDLVVIESVPD